MITNEKIAWIRQHLRRGDRKLINKTVPWVQYKTLTDILTGKMYGPNGAAVIAAAEKFIRKRIQRENKERKQYAMINQPDHQ